LRRGKAGAFALSLGATALTVFLTSIAAHAAGGIAEVRLEGNHRVESDAIRGHITATVGSSFDRAVVDRDIKDIYAMGFFDNVWATARQTPAGLDLAYHVAERPYIEEIRFKGVKKVKTQDLEAVINVTPRTIFDPQRAFGGLEQARKFYSSQGYPDAKIDFEMEVGPDNAGTLRYGVEEGKLIRVKQIRFEGVKAFKQRKLRKLMTTRQSWIFSFLTGAGLLNEDELNTDVDRLTAFYYDNGYIHVRVDEPKVDRVGNALIVTMKIDEGPQFHVGDISFKGDVLLSEQELSSELKFKRGDVFRTSQLRDSIFDLTEAYGDLGYAFAEVEPGHEHERGSADRRHRLQLQERRGRQHPAHRNRRQHEDARQGDPARARGERGPAVLGNGAPPQQAQREAPRVLRRSRAHDEPHRAEGPGRPARESEGGPHRGVLGGCRLQLGRQLPVQRAHQRAQPVRPRTARRVERRHRNDPPELPVQLHRTVVPRAPHRRRLRLSSTGAWNTTVSGAAGSASRCALPTRSGASASTRSSACRCPRCARDSSTASRKRRSTASTAARRPTSSTSRGPG
jgi:hypothetical protein